jgi:hypothetical protein
MSTPILRSGGAARRNLPASARADFGQARSRTTISDACAVNSCNSSAAVPSHRVRVAMNRRTASPTGLASMTISFAAAMFSR